MFVGCEKQWDNKVHLTIYRAGFQSALLVMKDPEIPLVIDTLLRYLKSKSSGQDEVGENCFFRGGHGCGNIRLDVPWKPLDE